MNEISIHTDKSRIDIDLMYQFLKNSYWANKRSKADVIKSIKNSMCFTMLKDGHQIGFARVITDRITFGYIADVFIIASERGNGYGTKLMKNICFHEALKDVQSWYLITKDAQKVYHKLGFKKYNKPDKEIMFASKDDLIT